MYRAYQPLFPTASRYLQKKWDKSNYQEHRRKVEMAAPVVSTTALPTPLHLQVNLKKMQLEKERRAVQDRDDLLHYTRLEGIRQSQGRVDNWNFYCRHSLNREKRRRDLEQVYWENQRLRKRLEGKKSELAQERWQQDWHKEQLVHNSHAWYPRSSRSCQAGAERRRQRTGCSSSPASASAGNPSNSPNRTCIPCGSPRTGVMGKRFWGSRNEPAAEGQRTTTAFSPSFVRKRDRTQPSGSLAQRPSKGALTSAKGLSATDADGFLARADLPRGASLERPTMEAVGPPTKPPSSLQLREKFRLSEKNPVPTSKEMRRKLELPTQHTEPCCERTKTDSKFDE